MRSLKSWHWKVAAGSSHLSNCRTRPPFSSISGSPRGRGGTSPSSLTSSAQLWKDPLLPAELKALCCTIVPTAQNALFLWHCPPLDSPLSVLPRFPLPGRKEAPFPSPVLPERLARELSAVCHGKPVGKDNYWKAGCGPGSVSFVTFRASACDGKCTKLCV